MLKMAQNRLLPCQMLVLLPARSLVEAGLWDKAEALERLGGDEDLLE